MQEAYPHRGRSMAEYGQIMGRVIPAEQVARSVRSYRPRPTDIVISPYSKCGATWLQQMFHTLRTGGDMDFDDISRVVPWIETASMLGLDLEAPQRAEPRGFKSHLAYHHMPMGAHYIVCFRDPKDALVSLHRFMEGWFLEPGAVTIGDFSRTWLKGSAEGSNYWQHLVSWWEQRDNPNVLLLSYEQMIANPAAAIRKVAAFCGVALDDALLALTLEHTSLAFMLHHKDRFDDAMLRKLSERLCNLPPGSDSAKVRDGVVGGHRHVLPDDVAAKLDAAWAGTVMPITGHADYASLVADLRP